MIVDHDRQLIRRGSVAAGHDEVVDLAGLHAGGATQAVLEPHRPIRGAKPHRRRLSGFDAAERFRPRQLTARVSERPASLACLLLRATQLAGAFEAVVGLLGLEQPRHRIAVKLAALRLPVGAAVATDVGPSSQSIPSQRRISYVCCSAPATLRAASVSSIRSTSVPFAARATNQLISAVRALPRCSLPVGLGAKRSRGLSRAMRHGREHRLRRQLGHRHPRYPAVAAEEQQQNGQANPHLKHYGNARRGGKIQRHCRFDDR